MYRWKKLRLKTWWHQLNLGSQIQSVMTFDADRSVTASDTKIEH